MNTLRHKTVTLIALGALALAPAAFAHEGLAGSGDAGDGHETTSSSTVREHGVSTSTDMEEGEGASSSTDEEASSTEHGNGKPWHIATSTASSTWARGEGESGEHNDKGEAHRSDVANVVHELLLVADRDGGIGEEVREAALQEASSSASTTEAMDTLDGESGWKVFLLGPDYKSLGALRSTLVTTDNSIARLMQARNRTTSSSTQAELDTQIAALEDISSSTSAYLDAHSGGFSLFGWLVRLF